MQNECVVCFVIDNIHEEPMQVMHTCGSGSGSGGGGGGAHAILLYNMIITA